jgi:hypothetical protein
MLFCAFLLHLHPQKQRRGLEDTAFLPGMGPAHDLATLLNTWILEGDRRSDPAGNGCHITVAPLGGYPGPSRITLYGQFANLCLSHLLTTLAHQPYLFLDQQTYTYSLDMTHPAWAGVRTWQDLMQPENSCFIRFRMVTPLTLTPYETHSGAITRFPCPQSLFASIMKHWQKLAGPPLPEGLSDALHAGHCLLADYQLSLIPVPRGCASQHHLGFLGWVHYECRLIQPSFRTFLHALVQFACFTGIGYGREHGMGLIEQDARFPKRREA